MKGLHCVALRLEQVLRHPHKLQAAPWKRLYPSEAQQAAPSLCQGDQAGLLTAEDGYRMGRQRLVRQ